MRKARGAFTLIEVMISVVIISTVITALLELFSNNTHIFSTLEKQNRSNQSLSFMLSNNDYGFNDEKLTLYDLVADFDLENDLRQKLKNEKVEIVYQELDSIDMSEYDPDEDENNPINDDEINPNEEEQGSSDLVFEIGKTILKSKDSSSSMLRIRLQ
jgi:prepilin-type N-terminal cleavage/methylation domain-containing protein